MEDMHSKFAHTDNSTEVLRQLRENRRQMFCFVLLPVGLGPFEPWPGCNKQEQKLGARGGQAGKMVVKWAGDCMNVESTPLVSRRQRLLGSSLPLAWPMRLVIHHAKMVERFSREAGNSVLTVQGFILTVC